MHARTKWLLISRALPVMKSCIHNVSSQQGLGIPGIFAFSRFKFKGKRDQFDQRPTGSSAYDTPLDRTSGLNNGQLQVHTRIAADPPSVIVTAFKREPGLLADHPDCRLNAALGGEGDAHQDQTLELDSRAVSPAQRRMTPLSILLTIRISLTASSRVQCEDVTIRARSSLAICKARLPRDITRRPLSNLTLN